MDPQHNLIAYEKFDEETNTTTPTPPSPRPNRKTDQHEKSPPPKRTKRTKGNGKKKVKKPKRKNTGKTKRKASGLVNEQFMNLLTDNRYIPDNRSGIQFIEHQSYGRNPDGSRIIPRVERKIKTTRIPSSNSKIKKTRTQK
tara:strand:- start:4250 stop:4672 length:423 start_codon:yes stop_codon:yes gene_type:complete